MKFKEKIFNGTATAEFSIFRRHLDFSFACSYSDEASLLHDCLRRRNPRTLTITIIGGGGHVETTFAIIAAINKFASSGRRVSIKLDFPASTGVLYFLCKHRVAEFTVDGYLIFHPISYDMSAERDANIAKTLVPTIDFLKNIGNYATWLSDKDTLFEHRNLRTLYCYMNAQLTTLEKFLENVALTNPRYCNKCVGYEGFNSSITSTLTLPNSNIVDLCNFRASEYQKILDELGTNKTQTNE